MFRAIISATWPSFRSRDAMKLATAPRDFGVIARIAAISMNVEVGLYAYRHIIGYRRHQRHCIAALIGVPASAMSVHGNGNRLARRDHVPRLRPSA
jgi:hypothetical protein